MFVGFSVIAGRLVGCVVLLAWSGIWCVYLCDCLVVLYLCLLTDNCCYKLSVLDVG